MNKAIEQMMSRYKPKNEREADHALREVMQELTLYALSRTDFFNKAAFMGGTALRMIHGLDRFSEDLDFMLINPSEEFTLDEYIENIEKTLEQFNIGLKTEVSKKKTHSHIKEGIVKANTKETYLLFYPEKDFSNNIYNTQLTKIKLEVDVEPASGAVFERCYRTMPYGYTLTVCDVPTMFSGKIHATLIQDSYGMYHDPGSASCRTQTLRSAYSASRSDAVRDGVRCG